MKQTKIWHIGSKNMHANGDKPNVVESKMTHHFQQPDPESADRLDIQLKEAAALLGAGGVIAFPTETVYGLGADATNTEAVQKVFEAKGRPSDNPLIIHIAEITQLNSIVQECPDLAHTLIDAFWPGPLTIVMPVREGILSPLVTAGLPTVGVRMPDHEAALSLIRLSGKPIAAPSANRSGKPSPTLAEHVANDLTGRIDGIVDSGATGVGLESTVVELIGEHTIRILRPGGVTAEELQKAAPNARIDRGAAALLESEAPRSPGMKYAHYAPQGELTLVRGDAEAVITYINEQSAAAKRRGERTGVLAFEERLASYQADLVLSSGSERLLQQGAYLLYDALRSFDNAGTERIWAEVCSEEGIGAALMNRMMKAAGSSIITLK